MVSKIELDGLHVGFRFSSHVFVITASGAAVKRFHKIEIATLF